MKPTATWALQGFRKIFDEESYRNWTIIMKKTPWIIKKPLDTLPVDGHQLGLNRSLWRKCLARSVRHVSDIILENNAVGAWNDQFGLRRELNAWKAINRSHENGGKRHKL